MNREIGLVGLFQCNRNRRGTESALHITRFSFLSTVTTNDVAQWTQKGGITNKPMTYRRFLNAIEADGLLDN